ncbi:amino acid ABC transporter permease [Pseudomonas taiwanensis]|uniref:amino acid ABC transporter permease n=1 Tax=Pseudomonas taiwanensis TaxID=470150 RepID=UPI001644A2F9|nr:amino acid ABC transporter permease [Pseudomonas taiwanensis]MBC3492449.1 amino acid ABC transporter permease [Pseudomonas taiwanensis]
MDALNIVAKLAAGLPWTIALTLVSFLIGAVIAIPLCALRSGRNKFLSYLGATVILIVRSVPPIVWLFAVFFAVGQHVVRISPFTAAVIGLSIITAANLAEIYRGSLKAIPKGQTEASKVIGLSTWQRYRYVLAPQVFRYSLPSASSYAIGLLKDTAIASVIGVSDVAQIANQLTQQTFQGLQIYAWAAVAYFSLSFLMAYLSRVIDARMRLRIER